MARQATVRTVRGLRNTRDLRAEVLDLAVAVATGNADSEGRLEVLAPVIAADTVRAEWQRLLPALAPGVRKRMELVVTPAPRNAAVRSAGNGTGQLTRPRPNYRFEVLRVLVCAHLRGAGAVALQALIETIGVSQTPIRAALLELKQAGLLQSGARRSIELAIGPEELSLELLAKIGALPQIQRFRFERGAPTSPPGALLDRAVSLLRGRSPAGWNALALSGIPVAQAEAPALDLLGLPRLDLVAHVGPRATAFDAGLLRRLHDGLEPEPNPLVPAPVAVTIVHAQAPFFRNAVLGRARCAGRGDILLSLLDLGLRRQAIQYARAVRP